MKPYEIKSERGTYMKTRKMTFGAFCLALALLLPQLFHMLGMQQAGQIFLPMHIPVLIGGMVLGWQYGTLLGFVAPLISCVLTGMPSAERVVFMMAELGSYGFISGLFYQQLSIKDQMLGGYLSLIAAMISGRLVYGLTLTLAAALFHMNLGGFAAVWAAVITGIPGIITQLIFLPALVRVVEKGGYIYEACTSETAAK